jgi:hypothetical protein
MEASVVRRRLHTWCDADEETVRPLLLELQRLGCLSNGPIVAPRWETNVYPLYYWASHRVRAREPYAWVYYQLTVSAVGGGRAIVGVDDAPMPPEELRVHVRRMVDSEIDILIEDRDYFVFIEAKEPGVGRKAVFADKGGLRQLIRQYVQGVVSVKVWKSSGIIDPARDPELMSPATRPSSASP